MEPLKQTGENPGFGVVIAHSTKEPNSRRARDAVKFLVQRPKFTVGKERGSQKVYINQPDSAAPKPSIFDQPHHLRLGCQSRFGECLEVG